MNKLTGNVRLVNGFFKQNIVGVEYTETDPDLNVTSLNWRKAKVSDVYLLGEIIDKQSKELNPIKQFGTGVRYVGY